MSISGRHRSPLLRESQDLPKILQFSERCPAGRLFCAFPFKVIYQLYPTANVFAQLIYQFAKQRYRHFFHMLYTTIYRQFRNKLQKHCNLEVPPHFLGPFLCNLSNYADCIVFRSKFIHFGNAVKSPQITRAIFVRFCPYHFNLHLSFSIPFVIIFVYNEPCAVRPAHF